MADEPLPINVTDKELELAINQLILATRNCGEPWPHIKSALWILLRIHGRRCCEEQKIAK